MDKEKHAKLIAELEKEHESNKNLLNEYLESLVVKRNRTSLMMNSFMHNLVDIENSVETSQNFLK